MMKEKKRLIIMAGGTGGHIFSGLAVAQRLILYGWQVRWLGTADHMEAALVPKHGIEIDFIPIKGLRGKCVKEQCMVLVSIIGAVFKARKIMRYWKPNVVLSMGGYVAGPGGLAAWSCGIPVLLHEQNVIAGLTNRWLSTIAHKVLQAYSGTFTKGVVVGNPLRATVLEIPTPALRLHERFGPIRVLVIGGSQGAKVLNQTMPYVARKLVGKIVVWHQVGKNGLQEVIRAYDSNRYIKHMVSDFIDDIAKAYTWADLVISRAGAVTVSEIAAAGLPALFVPFMHRDRHQYFNARLLESRGAAKIIEQPYFTVENVSKILESWDRPTLATMSKLARGLAVPNAADMVALEVVMTVRS